ncbi:hypothetical protein NIES592_08155 [Fischerella major NIES-592]|uniref:Uncharacterized protein n=1 Tax=Fischerella major NIES-592 TaxID=210994 RepID=A0A1U7H1J2_9CYAN|nr:hypothetical protein [Fischerella major]OKH14840.1 hypothetical protein NIES592_08155 [Fischerella major NIES-592]
MDLESLAGIRHSLQDSRRDGLTLFMNEFMTVLLSEGYTFEDLLHALANWASEQPRLEEIVGYLEKATDEIHSTN